MSRKSGLLCTIGLLPGLLAACGKPLPADKLHKFKACMAEAPGDWHLASVLKVQGYGARERLVTTEIDHATLYTGNNNYLLVQVSETGAAVSADVIRGHDYRYKALDQPPDEAAHMTPKEKRAASMVLECVDKSIVESSAPPVRPADLVLAPPGLVSKP